MNTKINYKIRKAKLSDAKQFVELLNYVWRDAYKNIFPKEVLMTESQKLKIR